MNSSGLRIPIYISVLLRVHATGCPRSRPLTSPDASAAAQGKPQHNPAKVFTQVSSCFLVLLKYSFRWFVDFALFDQTMEHFCRR